MKKILLLLICLMNVVVVNAEVTATTPSIGAEVASDPTIESLVNAEIAKNGPLKNATKGYYIEGLSITCSTGKNTITYINKKLTTDLVCANKNANPYYNLLSSGTSSFENGSACTSADNKPYAFATRVYEYDCAYVLGSGNEKEDYVPTPAPEPDASNPSTDNTTKPSANNTTKPTGTTDNKDTGVENYFITLGSIGLVVIATLYIVDKKNVFKKI